VDPGMQQQAEKVLAGALPNPGDPYDALASVDPRTGYVRALVGGRDYSTEKFNIAIQGRRQPGSAFKPFVMVAALENGVTPSTTFSGPSSICLAGWKPGCNVSNFDNESFGRITLETATIHSVNTVYAQLVLKVGAGRTVDAAKRMGIPGPAWLPARPAAGKTGTAEDFRNAWFVGYTPDLSTALWMGYRDANRAMRGIHGVAQVSGGTLPAQIWSSYMKGALAGVPASPFAPPVVPSTDSGFRLPAPSSLTPTPSPS